MEQLGTVAQNLKPERRHLVADLIAGLTFAVVNVPQAMAHALLATVNPVFGIYTLMVAVPIGAIFTSSVYHERVHHQRAVGGRGRWAGGHPCQPEGGGAGRAGAVGGRDSVAGGPVPAGVPDPLRLQRGDDRLSQRRGRADHPGPVGRPDGLPSSVYSNNVAQALDLLSAFGPDQCPDDDHRRADTGGDRAAAAQRRCASSPSSSLSSWRPSCWPS